MSKYSVIILPKAIHGLSGINKHVAKGITDKLTWLSGNVGSINTLPLTGELSGLFKLKIGDYRAIYELSHNKSILKDELEEYFLRRKAFSPQSIVQAIFHEDTLKTIRKHLKKATGVSADEDELADRIKDMLSKETWKEIGDVKIKRKRKTHKAKTRDRNNTCTTSRSHYTCNNNRRTRR